MQTLSNGENIAAKALIIPEAKDLKKDLKMEEKPDEKYISKTEPIRNPLDIFKSTEDFEVILDHAISHGRVMLEEYLEKPIDRRSMIFA